MTDTRKPTIPEGSGMEPEQRQATVPDLGTTPEPGVPAAPSPTGPHGWMPQQATVGDTVAGRYRLQEKIGSGGMGTIYLAEHTAIGKRVAVKILAPKLLREPTALPRFLREAKAASQIGHPNVCDVTDYGEVEGGGAFFAMEYLEGESLYAVLRRDKRLPWSRVANIARQMLSALAAAHDRNIVHRDMKPANIFLLSGEGSEDLVKVLDFGIAKVLHNDPSGASVITASGIVMGTPRYMSPEQARGEEPDHRTDLYSVGILLYELLTGSPPFSDKNPMQIIRQHVKTPPKPLREAAPDAEIPGYAEAIVLKALAKDRDERYQTAAEFIDAIDESQGANTTAQQPAVPVSELEETVWDGPKSRPASPAHLLYLGVGIGIVVSSLVGLVLWMALRG